MSEPISDRLTLQPLNDEAVKLVDRSNKCMVRNGTLLALTEKCNRLESENNRLRKEAKERGELIRDMMKFFEDDDACEHCGHDLECWNQNGLIIAYSEDCLMRNVFKERMHELGIEEHL